MITNSLPAYKSIKPMNSPAFGKGEVKLWTDFDGTLYPAEDEELTNKRLVKRLKKYFTQVAEFFNKSRDQAELNITTGRNFVSFYKTFSLLKRTGVNVPVPKHLAITNGGDIYLKSNKNATTPDCTNIDKSKLEDFKRSANWDGEFVRKSIEEVFEQRNIALCRPLNINPNPREILYPVLRNDGKLHICIDFPQQMVTEEFIKAISSEISSKLDAKGVKYTIKFDEYNEYINRGPCILISPKPDGKVLDKTYDIKKAIAEATKNEDLVIVAGDYQNDYTMLNPANYVNSPEEIDKLPLRGIVVGDDPKLLQLAKQYPDKIVVTSEFKLLDAIKKVIKDYSKKHPGFSLKEEIKAQL